MAIEKKYVETPLMSQYYSIKAVHPDAILLFRVGDFYETFGDDAIKASSILGITLTRRANGSASSVELAGFPYHALDTYLPKLVRAGERIAICEQLEDPKMVKGLVKRGVIELVTPGVVLGDGNTLTQKENSFLASIYFGAKSTGVAFLDISTGEFLMAEGNDKYIEKLLSNLSPKEIIYQRGYDDRFEKAFGDRYYTYRLEDWVFSSDINYDKLCKQFGTRSLKGFGVQSLKSGIAAAGAILYYLEFTEHREISHIKSISRIDENEYVWIDKFTIRNLELFSSNAQREKSGFVDIIDRTLTAMGGRLLKRWVALPLINVERIKRRQDVVEILAQDADFAVALREQIADIGDLERLSSRVATGRVLPRELVQLKNSLTAIENLKALLESSDDSRLHAIAENINPLATLRDKLHREIIPDPINNQIQKGGVIAEGVSAELDDLRRIALNGRNVLQMIQQRESEMTGIPSLKISYNNVFGYYIEVRNTHKDKVPETWIRKQTLANAERYITEELKEYEGKILGAQDRIITIETEIYTALVQHIATHLQTILKNAAEIARLDCLQGFAKLACEKRYVRPELDESTTIDIRDGRHPVIESLLPIGEEYIPNDVLLNDSEQQIMMITGPNMSGKSALLRQTALIILMAQMGSFVPASSARIGVVDKIFTRVGASDNISQGESTFMVEMLESASILNNISQRSLILLDEIGRGTSTYDGISIAWAMVEYIHNFPNAKAKTLFATHYHELNEMEQLFERVKNYHVSVKEVENTIVFLRRLARGGTEHSFGIHVARMAGMPKSIIKRANEILANLESTYGMQEGTSGVPTRQNRRRQPSAKQVADVAQQGNIQLSMFQLDDPVLVQIRDQIKGLDINSLTPLEALNKLNEIKKITGL
ncbi:MAG: DNA mismatch repair protein MutS [Alistipes sp.]|nr:DNA mismatch repair protein MutS [Alistipes sp.]